MLTPLPPLPWQYHEIAIVPPQGAQLQSNFRCYPMNLAKLADEIIESRKRLERDAMEARLATDEADPSRRPAHGALADATTCHHEFFLDGLGQCSNCGTYVGLPR